MKNLLFIDFGASRIKSIEYNVEKDLFYKQKEVPSPFLYKHAIPKDEVSNVLTNVMKKHDSFDAVFICTILGGGYVDDIYYSWKSSKNVKNKTCLISHIFKHDSTYHLHKDHGGLQDRIKQLGILNEKIVYSALGDTDCVKRSFLLKNDECIVNLGTGSQVIRNKSIIKYIPSGRALNCFENFFKNLDVNMFEIFKNLSTDQLIASDMNFNLNIFEQALHYDSTVCGSITNIREDNFTLINFICSLFKNYLDQYIPLIKSNKKIYLTGGISRKYPVIKEYFKVKTNAEVILNSRHIEDTFLGIKEKVLADYEHINHGI